MKTNYYKIKSRRIKSILYFVVAIFLSINFANASDSVGTVDSASLGFKYTKVCQDNACATFGNVNFKPTVIAGVTPIVINDTNIVGHAWGDQIGWINLNPTGLTGADILKVNPTTGVITGKAYSSSGSWINFSPTGAGVTLVDNGSGSNFSGYAWVSGAYGGWMKFDCASALTCIKTDWRVLSQRGVVTPPVIIPPVVTPPASLFFSGNSIVPSTTVSVTNTKSVPTKTLAPENTTIKSETNNNPSKEETTKLPVPNFPTPDTSINTENKSSSTEGKYKQVFPILETSFTENNCLFCIVVRDDSKSLVDVKGNITVLSDRKIIKYGFVPVSIEIPVSIKLINSEVPDVDVTSVVITTTAAWAIRRYVILALIRKFFIGV